MDPASIGRPNLSSCDLSVDIEHHDRAGLRGADEGLCTSRLLSAKLAYASAWDFDIAVTNLHDSRPMVVKELMGAPVHHHPEVPPHTPQRRQAAVTALDNIRKRTTT